MKKTKIVATLTEKRTEPKILKQLYKAGVNAIRLNTAHFTVDGADRTIHNIRNVSDKIAIIIDTKGPEIRTAKMDRDVPLKKGEQVILKDVGFECKEKCITINHKDFSSHISKGNRILIDDGELQLLVTKKSKHLLYCKTLNKGVIKSHKSINVPNVKINNPTLNKKDKDYIKLAISHNVDFIAHSFVRSKKDLKVIQDLLDKQKSKTKIIAKIENQEGLDNINEILDNAYGIMVARGDLGVELPAERIPFVQKEIIKKCIERRRPVIIATQMLHSMIENPRPTRAEVNDVANAILDGADALMLSGETAYGDYPLESVQTMTNIALEVEKQNPARTDVKPNTGSPVSGFLARAAAIASTQLDLKAILTDTMTGRTARFLSAFRSDKPVYAHCYDENVMRQLAISYGIESFYMQPTKTSSAFVKTSLNNLMKKKMIAKKDLVLVLAGNFGPTHGASFIEISQVENILKIY